MIMRSMAGGPRPKPAEQSVEESKAPTSDPSGLWSSSEGGRRRASGIYGTIVVAATIATGGHFLHTWALAVSVVVTLLVYWLAEQYAEILGEHTHAGRLPDLARVRASLANSWPLVTASYVPVVVLVLARVVGASPGNAAQIGLIATTLLLVVHGHAAGRAAGLTGLRLLAVTAAAAVLGAGMIALKALVVAHH